MSNNGCKEEMISIIVPVFNIKEYISECIDSILHQTYRNLEVIIIDDGSSDGSSDICDNYLNTDHRIKVIHQKNSGLSAARNCGINISEGGVSFIC